METTEFQEKLKYAKGKLHLRYILVIAGILCLGSIILSAHNQTAFVSQVSFGATITSIVLSVIAIWLSISGERSTNEIRISIADSANKLSNTASDIENINSNFEKTMVTQLNELRNVQHELNQLTISVNSIEKQPSYQNSHETRESNISRFTSEQCVQYFQNIHSWVYDSVDSDFLDSLFCEMVKCMIKQYQNNQAIWLTDIISVLSKRYSIKDNIRDIFMFWGIINTLIAFSIFDDKDAVEKILNEINT